MPQLEQSWNKRSKKWVLIDTSCKGGIKEMSDKKFPGVPVKKDKPTKNGSDSKDSQHTKNTENPGSESDSESGFFNW